MIHSIEQHVEYVASIIGSLNAAQAARIEASREAEQAWTDHCDQTAAMTLLPQANSWYMGANVPGKPRVFMPYIGGMAKYRRICDEVAENGYEGFALGA